MRIFITIYTGVCELNPRFFIFLFFFKIDCAELMCIAVFDVSTAAGGKESCGNEVK